MHVTNTAPHLDHPDLVIDQDPAKEDSGAVRSLSALLKRMTADGLDGGQVFGEIKALVEWLVRLIAADGLFARTYHADGRRVLARHVFRRHAAGGARPHHSEIARFDHCHQAPRGGVTQMRVVTPA